MKKAHLAFIAVAASALFLPAKAQGLSYNIGVVSLYKANGLDYDFRSSTSARPAIQGGVDYSFGNGFYVGNWNSSGEFGDASMEVDLYGGYATSMANGVSLDVGVASYIYPGEAAENGTDVYVTAGYGIASVKATRGIKGSVEDKSRYSITLSQPVSEQVTARVTLGTTNKERGGHDFFVVGASYSLGDGTVLSANYSGAGKDDNGVKPIFHKSRLVLGVSKSF